MQLYSSRWPRQGSWAVLGSFFVALTLFAFHSIAAVQRNVPQLPSARADESSFAVATRRAVAANAMEPSATRLGARMLRVARAPTDQQGRLHAGPLFLPGDSAPRAIGGGPGPTPSTVENVDLATTRGVQSVTGRTVSVPIGCVRISAAGTPRVKRLRLSVVDGRGVVLAQRERRGREVEANYCPRARGTVRVVARATDGDVSEPVQIFVE